MNEIAHFMIYSEIDPSFVHVPLQQRAFAEHIENDTPASDLGMMVAARVVLPAAEHPSFQTDSQIKVSVLRYTSQCRPPKLPLSKWASAACPPGRKPLLRFCISTRHRPGRRAAINGVSLMISTK